MQAWHRIMAATAIVALVGAYTLAQTRPATGPSSQPATRRAPVRKEKPRLVAVAEIVSADNTEDTRQALDALSTIHDLFHYEHRPFKAVLVDLKEECGINLVANWGDLKSVGVLPETPITLELRQVSVAQALRSTLDLAAAGKLDYVVSEGVVEVNTKTWLAKRAYPFLYDPQRLLENPFHAATEDPLARAKKLAEVLRGVTTPELWSDKAAKLDAYKVGRDMKVAVSGSLRAHWEISGVYDELLRPIRIPATRAEAAAELKGSGEPVKLPPRLQETAGHKRAVQKYVARDVLAVSDQPLGRVLKNLADSGAPGPIGLVVCWNTLADLGLTPETKVSARTAEAPWAERLAAALAAPAGGRAQDVLITLSPEGVVTVGTRGALSTGEVQAVYDLRDLIKRQIFLAGANAPTTRQAAQAIVEDLTKQGQAAGWAARTKFMEFEGRLAVRAVPEDQRAVARALAGMAK